MSAHTEDAAPTGVTTGMSTEDYAAACGVAPSTVGQWIRNGDVQAIRDGSRTLVTTDVPASGIGLAEFAAACGASYDVVRQWALDGKVQSVRVGWRWVITSDPAEHQVSSVPAGHHTITEFAVACGVTRQAVHYWVAAARVDWTRINDRVYITSDPAEHQKGERV